MKKLSISLLSVFFAMMMVVSSTVAVFAAEAEAPVVQPEAQTTESGSQPQGTETPAPDATPVPTSSPEGATVPAPEPAATPAPATEIEVATQTEDETGVWVNAYLVNTNGENINLEGTVLPAGEKYSVGRYKAALSGDIVFGSPVQLAQTDMYTDAQGREYQFRQGLPGIFNPDDDIVLTEEQPTLEVDLPYSLPRTLTLYKKDGIASGWSTFVTKQFNTGDLVNLADYYVTPVDLTNPVGIKDGSRFLGWASDEQGTNILYPADVAPFLMKGDNVTLYGAIQGTTARILVKNYLVNKAGEPIDWAGNVIASADESQWILINEYYMQVDGTENLPINKSYKLPLGQYSIKAVAQGQTTEKSFTVFTNWDYYYTYQMNWYDKAIDLKGDMVVRFGYRMYYDNQFVRNYPADASNYAYANLPGSTDSAFVLSFLDGKDILLNTVEPISGEATAYKSLSVYGGKSALPDNYTFLGWSTTQYGVIDNVDTLKNDADFHAVGVQKIPQPAYETVYYAVWGSKTLSKVKVNPASVVPYLVNGQGKPMNWDGTTFDFDVDSIVKIDYKLGMYNLLNTYYNMDLVPGIYYDLSPQLSFTTNVTVGGATTSRNFSNVPNAVLYGASRQPIKVRADENGNLFDVDGNAVTLYYGYSANFKAIVHSNYPSDSGLTNTSIAIDPTDKIFFWGTYSYGFSKNPPAGYAFFGYTDKLDAAGKPDPSGKLYNFIEKTTLPTLDKGDLNLYAIWVPESQVAKVNVYSIWVNEALAPLDANGNVLNAGNFEAGKYIIRPQLVATLSMPYLEGGTTYNFGQLYFYNGNITGTDGKTYLPPESTRNYPMWLDSSLNKHYTSAMVANASTPSTMYCGYVSAHKLTLNPNYPAAAGLANTPYSKDYIVGQTVYTNSFYPGGLASVEGFVFKGWSEDKDGLNNLWPLTTNQFGGKVFAMPARNVTLYAQWEYTLTPPEFGTITVISYYTDENGQPLKEDGSPAANVNEAYAINSYTYTNEGQTQLKTGFTYYPGAKNFTKDSARYLYNPQSVSYGGGASLAPITFGVGQTNVKVYFGYKKAVSYVINYNVNLPADAAQYASQVGQPVYTNNRFAQGEVVKEELANLNTAAFPEGFTYIFAGWTMEQNPNSTATIYSKTASGLVMPANDVTLYAKWIATYSVTFKAGANGSLTGAASNGEVLHKGLTAGQAVPAAPVATANTGWKFIGWSNSYSPSMTVSSNLVFEAQWESTSNKEEPVAPPENKDNSDPSTPTTNPVRPATPVAPVAPVVTPAPSSPVAVTPAPATTSVAAAPEQTKETAPVEAAVASEAPTIKLAGNDVPLFGMNNEKTWGLLNLVLALLAIVVSAAVLLRRGVVAAKRRKDDTAENDGKTNKATLFHLVAMLVGIAPIILFLLFENMKNPMVVVNGLTPLIALLAVVQLVVVVLSAVRKNEDQPEVSEEI